MPFFMAETTNTAVLTSDSRLATAMIYLKSAQAGGRTVFPLLSLSVPASPLSLLFWHNLTPDLQAARYLQTLLTLTLVEIMILLRQLSYEMETL